MPPDWARYGNSVFPGVLTGRDDEWIHISDLADLTSYEMSYGALMTSVSITIFVRDDTPYGGSYNISRSMQFGTGVGISVGIFGLPWFLNFSFSISDETHLALGFVAGEQFDEAQCEALRAARDGGSRSRNMELAASALRNHQSDAVGTEAVLLDAGLDALAEMLEQIGTEEGRGPEDGIPALSNGDFFGEFLARDADALVPLDETADTSLDALLTRTYENIADNSEQFDDLGVIEAVVLEGTGISADACLYIDGELFEDAAVLYTITAPEQVLWAQEGWIPLDGEHEIQVVNPGDVASDPFVHEFVE